MPARIAFPDHPPRWEFSRDCVSFPALVDAQPVRCLISLELLMERFGAKQDSGEEALRVFLQNRQAIQAMAVSQLETGNFTPDDEVSLTTRHFRLGEITYSQKTKQWGEGFALIQRATRVLQEVLGPYASQLVAEWDGKLEDKTPPVYWLTLTDTVLGETVRATFTPEELSSRSHMRFRLSGLWGDLLQARSRRQLRELQGAPVPSEG